MCSLGVLIMNKDKVKIVAYKTFGESSDKNTKAAKLKIRAPHYNFYIFSPGLCFLYNKY